MLDDILKRLSALPKEEREGLKRDVLERTRGMLWVPNPGPQHDALYSDADELYFGGAAGGGKSSLLIGLAIQYHERSIIFRREYPQIKGLEDEAAKILGSRAGYNSQDKIWRIPGNNRIMEFGSVPHAKDVERFQGRAHDLICFDELPTFTESQYRFLIGWNRSATPGQRCRVVCAGNPPLSAEAYWVCKYWGPWLDQTHPNPARPGELRWFTTIDGRDVELSGPEPVEVNGVMVSPRSRTFIPARLEDNPDLMRSGYAAVLEAMPEELRVRLREGRFDAGLEDDEFQVIPTAWVIAAQARWTSTPPDGAPMDAIGVDVAQGGKDETVLAPRHGVWCGELIAKKGIDTKDGPAVAGLILMTARNAAQANIDMGGGWGGSALDHLRGLDYPVKGYVGAAASTGRTRDGRLGFVNLRAETWWNLREAMDPNQKYPAALPPDPQLRADLCAPRWELTPRGIKVELKENIKERIGRSPDRGDAVVLAFANGKARVRPRKTGALPTRTNGGYTDFKARMRAGQPRRS